MSLTYNTSITNLFIGISGIIGAGKTTIATRLADRLGVEVYYEPVKTNKYLADFYKDPGRYSFNMQIHLLGQRFEQHQAIVWSGRGGIQDRTIYEDTIFATMLYKKGLMDERDYETYIRLFKNMANFMQKPNVILHLDVSPEVALSRVRGRGRDAEANLSLEYLQNLHEEYGIFLNQIEESVKVIRIPYNEPVPSEVIIGAINQSNAIKTLGSVVK